MSPAGNLEPSWALALAIHLLPRSPVRWCVPLADAHVSRSLPVTGKEMHGAIIIPPVPSPILMPSVHPSSRHTQTIRLCVSPSLKPPLAASLNTSFWWLATCVYPVNNLACG